MIMSDLTRAEFYHALGFALVAMRADVGPSTHTMQRARDLSQLIEEFCIEAAATSSAPTAQSLVTSDAMRDLLVQAASALELCISCSDLTWEAEQEADLVMQRLRRAVG